MSQRNVDIVRRCYRVWDQRDWSQIPALADPDVTIDLSRNVFNPDVYHGVAGFYRLVSVIEDVWEDLQQVPTEVIDAGDNVVAAVTVRGKGRESGVEVEMHALPSGLFATRRSCVSSVGIAIALRPSKPRACRNETGRHSYRTELPAGFPPAEMTR